MKRKPNQATSKEEDSEPSRSKEKKIIAVVGVGASAGGLEAFSELLRNLPSKTGMAFILIQHLDPHHPSQLVQILTRETTLTVKEATDEEILRPNQIYIIPPNREMTMKEGTLRLWARSEARGRHMPIDRFFSSMAEERGSEAIGIVLSGTASDGTRGLNAIKEKGGITIAQDERSARYSSMPSSAISSGHVDLVLTPRAIADELARISGHPYVNKQAEPKPSRDGRNKILTLLLSATGVDFTHYRQTTLLRRIQRRMILNRSEDFDAYVGLLQKSPSELEALHQDVLIHVTSFFREPEVFDDLRENVFPELTKDRNRTEPIRIWLPGSSTGEEVYSVAISLFEFLENLPLRPSIQIFGTDVSQRVVEKARSAIYGEAIEAEVSPDRLRSFFTKIDRGYQINKPIRDMCVFARQDVTKDPPFSKMDLISCRNVMIYFEPELQHRLIPLFHYALKSAGYLLLGSAENIGRYSDLFEVVSPKSKLFRKRPGSGHSPLNRRLPLISLVPSSESAKVELQEGGRELTRKADKSLMDRFCPPAVLVDQNLAILQFRGLVTPYLQPATGRASLNLFSMTLPALEFDLRSLINRAKSGEGVVRRDGLHIEVAGVSQNLSLEVIPVSGAESATFIIAFLAMPPSPRANPPEDPDDAQRQRIAELEDELVQTKEQVQSVIDEREVANEELRSANEEIQSSNEELQSTNEELETAKEELQSTNEELTTLNEELRHTNLELGEVNNDLLNLLRSVNIPVVMVGRDLRIRRFTPAAHQTLKLIPSDIGRLITDLQPDVQIPNLENQIREVIDSLVTKEIELQDKTGRWHSLLMRPYETLDNKISGAILILFDIEENKRRLLAKQQTVDFANALLETVRGASLLLDGNLRIKRATTSFYRLFQTNPEKTEGQLFYKIGDGEWDTPNLRSLLEEVLPKNLHVQDFELWQTLPNIGRRKLLLNAARTAELVDSDYLIVLSIEDVTPAT
ncbi:MAG: two-component system, chemotaxis family, CheB/CheR fusion protein [Verrucomicrobiota bacterium]